jgi:NitT/TauT family transport system ATP-binding protein
VSVGSLVIEFQGIKHEFSDRRTNTVALDGIDLAVSSGEFVSILGPSGCGKSTLLRLVAGLLEPTQGTATVNQQSPRNGRAAKAFALAPQQPALLPWRTVRQNAQLLVDVNPRQDHASSEALVNTLLGEVGLGDFADAFPHQLSGGMQQRVALVRAFALQAPILLLDEPFAALDELTRADMRHLLLRLWGSHQSTALFVTHSIAEAVLLSDRVVVMSGRPGRVAAIEAISLPRPRTADMEDTDVFDHHVRQLRRILRTADPR